MESKTILVIEDNESNMKLVRALLELGKHQVREAVDAETGIQLARKHPPDLILMDIQLPGMDGLSATRILKQDLGLKEVPIVALTSHAMQGDDQKALEAGCVGYITKPIDTRDFLTTVNHFLSNDGKEQKPPKQASTSHKPRLLIVDDDPANIKLLAAKLPQDKYEFFKAYSGEETLEKASSISPDLILLDIMMPGMNGYETTRRLKNDPNTQDIPIILITALDSSEDKMKGLDAGAEEFLSKPVNTTELLSRVNSLLRLKQYHEQFTLRTQSDEHFDDKAPPERLLEDTQAPSRILLVEDDEKDVRLIQSILDDLPYQINVVRSGEDALTFALKEKLDLILLDILLPGINGFEVCHRLKKMDETKDIQIIVISYLSDLESKIKGVEEGADDFLIKPINSREIRARVKVLLKKKAYLDKLHAHYKMALNSAISDGLTGLYNHAYFKRFLEFELKRSLRYGYPTCLVMVDLDNFKEYNDTLGHLTGDIILRETAHVIKQNVREIDFVARYGGEEFAVILPYADREGGLSAAERIRQAISSHIFLNDSASPVEKITASIGMAFCPANASTTRELIQKADFMLYQAKKEGKNRVCVFENYGTIKSKEIA